MNDVKRDPICGMVVDPAKALIHVHRGQPTYFCSTYCRDAFLAKPDCYATQAAARDARSADPTSRRIAYFSMEIAAISAMPTYAGGLGVLAADMLKSSADLSIPIVGVTLAYRHGYFDQTLDASGMQQEAPANWEPERYAQLLPNRIEIEIAGQSVIVRAWEYHLCGRTGYVVPVIMLDTNVDGNVDWLRAATDCLYGGDQSHRLVQEIVLGIGGARMLAALGYEGIERYHMNEGHASLLSLELLAAKSPSGDGGYDFDHVRDRCVFTTHTPVPAGHDRFDYSLVQRLLPMTIPLRVLQMLAGQDALNMTTLGINLSRYVNGVARRHEEVSRGMFPNHPIDHITNGVHAWSWTCDSFRALFDTHLPGWANDPAMLRQALGIAPEALWAAHTLAKRRLVECVAERTGIGLDPGALTIGFARRATAYKRPDLVLTDLARLRQIVQRVGPLQFVFAGKAHPSDSEGKDLLRRVVDAGRQLGSEIPVVFVENYDLDLARTMVSGVDLWLNTPRPPLEASGTSGMKAALNGVPSVSTLDGWWLEGYVEGMTGWAVDGRGTSASLDTADAEDLYRKLDEVIVPMFYRDRGAWIDVMRHTVALNASYFNTHRMVQQYATAAYRM